jgi:FMN-dependent NADH-azoreductase
MADVNSRLVRRVSRRAYALSTPGPEFDAETINAKYKGISGEPMTPAEVTAWEKIRELASRFQRADRIVMGVPMWNFSFPYKLKQPIDLSCQRNMLFTFDGKRYGPSLDIDTLGGAMAAFGKS